MNSDILNDSIRSQKRDLHSGRMAYDGYPISLSRRPGRKGPPELSHRPMLPKPWNLLSVWPVSPGNGDS